MTLVNPITGELTTLTAQQQQYITQATVTALSLTSDALAQRTLSQNLDSNRSQNVPIFSESVDVQPELSKTLRKKQKKAMNKLRLPNLSQSSESTVVSTSASLSSPVQSPVSIGTTHLVSDNTVAPSRYNPYQEKTIFLKGKIDRKTALTVVHNLKSIDCPFFPC
jgi:3-oxoacyl-(acyl-carrier-protein) synthase